MPQDNLKKNPFMPTVEDFFDSDTPQGRLTEMQENFPVVLGLFRDAYTTTYLAANTNATAEDAWRAWQSDVHGNQCVIEPETLGVFTKAINGDGEAINTIATKIGHSSPDKVRENLQLGQDNILTGMELYAEGEKVGTSDPTSIDLQGIIAMLGGGLGLKESERVGY